ncbi:EF-P beta-lysylation protein EpmB [Zooshikella ganghwensis]|uniref:L-lysine 2,3-aminomutase n=1 Tax=Zooshikella ganghwensis TaxID=202772 RepID=A0A4P9VHB0_9GAMM|nr:EF-P beta-lysylation protein EpmB [Zooshikella ganghwensis]RDH42493.1 EF-P beta-lysylation protein EpmB [Zooshikella ganghwensis]
MITRTAACVQGSRWQQTLSESITDPHELFELLGLDADLLPAANEASGSFPLRVPHPFVQRMRKGDINDPLLQQVLPTAAELISTAGYSVDPLAERPKNMHKGIIHKYKGRVLLVVGSTCAINCRYCFRRHFPYEENRLNKRQWQEALDYITKDDTIREVIYSGGDPLAVNDQRLKWLTEEIAKIPHIERLRVHTRLPIVIPERICPELLDWLTSTRLKTLVVVHCNHPNEIDDKVGFALQQLQQAGCTVLNQTVLLKGINDNPEVLISLSEKLVSWGAFPYYLHVLDKVQGAAHFDIDHAKAQHIVGQMMKLGSGYLIPKLTIEQAGAASKLLLPPLP